MVSLDLIPSKDLIDELMRRYDHAVFTGLKENIGMRGQHYITRRWTGEQTMCSGMCSQMEIIMAHAKIQQEKKTDEYM